MVVTVLRIHCLRLFTIRNKIAKATMAEFKLSFKKNSLVQKKKAKQKDFDELKFFFSSTSILKKAQRGSK